MRYVLAGAVVLGGLVLVGLAYHDTVAEAWTMLKAPASNRPDQPGPHDPGPNKNAG